jgi:exodeoxyribonuclease V alpha subunit
MIRRVERIAAPDPHDNSRTSPPTSVDGIEKYLSSGMIRGVGPVYAKKLVRAFGGKVFDVIEATADRLREVDGIGPVRRPA